MKLAVLTAHPTEVRRKSILDREMDLAQLLADRDRKQMTPEELAASEESILRAVLTLWQTSLLRHERPTVIDEVANGLSYYEQTFLRELPRPAEATREQRDDRRVLSGTGTLLLLPLPGPAHFLG